MSALQLAALKERAKAKQTPVLSRPSSRQVDPSVMCICNRKLQDVLCRSCGFIFVGRVRKHCRLHPNEILLMDSAVCPKCRTDSLLEIQSSNTHVEKEADAVMDEIAHLRQQRHREDERHRRSSNGFCADDWDRECNPLLMKPEKDSHRMKIPSATGGLMGSSVSPESIQNLPKMSYRE